MNKLTVSVLSFTAGIITGIVVSQFIKSNHETKEEPNKDIVRAVDIVKENSQEEPENDPAESEYPKDDDPAELISSGPAHIAMPGKRGVNYAKVQQIVKENGYTDPEDIQRVINDPANSETYEERVARQSVIVDEDDEEDDEEDPEIEIDEEELGIADEIKELQRMEDRKKNKGKIIPISKEDWDAGELDSGDFDRQELYYFTEDNKLTDEDGNYVDEMECMGPKPRQFGWMANSEQTIYIRNYPKMTEYKVWKTEATSVEWWR